MSESKSISDITAASLQHQQTESSPLKQGNTKKNWLSSILWFSKDEDEGSLRNIILFFFVFTVLITLGLLAQIYYGVNQIQPHGSVATDSLDCSEIGINILKKGGNAVDAAIASTLCLGVVNFHITGLGGGGYMMIYSHVKREVIDILDFQVTIPRALENKEVEATLGGLTVGVPGFLMGLWEAHIKYGKVHWEELIRPSINLAKYGFIINENVVTARTRLKSKTKFNKNLIEFLNSLSLGKNITMPDLAATLETIAVSGPHALYNGSIAKEIVSAVNKAGGNLTLEDLSQYQLSNNETLHTTFSNFDILAAGSSSGGALLLNALDTIQFLDLTPSDDITSITLRIADILHDTYVSFLQKNDANPFASEQAASQVSAVDNEELYVSVVTGLNTWLGSQILTKAGFILNNGISNGGINDKGRPLSLSTPVIAVESGEICGKRFILGSGDATIAAQLLTNALVLNRDLNTSIEFPRFFVNNVPRLIKLEDLHSPFYSPDTLSKLSTFFKLDQILIPYKSINVIEKEGDLVYAHSDSRGGGVASKF